MEIHYQLSQIDAKIVKYLQATYPQVINLRMMIIFLLTNVYLTKYKERLHNKAINEKNTIAAKSHT